MYQIGDHVVVREWDEMEEEFGLNDAGNIDCECIFVKDMQRYCGMEMEVVGARGDIYTLSDGGGYAFSSDMLVPAKEDDMGDAVGMEDLEAIWEM